MQVKVQFYRLPWAGKNIYCQVVGNTINQEAILIGEPVEVDVPIKVCECCNQEINEK